ncbi:hypothetical protein DMC30DRAFT_447229 [Rhodotorula diobovata]|uniref:Uncharacterized protein n=1 Tax=Rhodotorula diobovata TaxID=5288 RepID=A0A5C5FV70_9BASI|nr:hypothetical protein DMC30DRAFT_447229 [Rhodotorula diobovata]
MERRRSAALTRPQTPPIRPIPIRPAAGTHSSKATTPPPQRVRFSPPCEARPPSPALSRSSALGQPPPPRPLSRVGAVPAPPRPALARAATYTSAVAPRSASPGHSGSPAHPSTRLPSPGPLARLSTPPSPWRPPPLPRPAPRIDTANQWTLRRPVSNPALHRPSSLYASRRTGLATPPPSRPNSGSSRASFQAVPPHLSFLDPSIPPLPFSPSEHPEGTVVEESNLFIARGKPRLGLTHWQHAAVYRAHQALDEYVPEVRELSRRAREQGRAAVDKLRLEVYMPVRTLVETAVAVLRMLQSGEEGMEMMAAVASRLVHLRWGDDEEWKGISHLHFDRAIDAIGISHRNTRIVSEFTALAVETFQDRPRLSKITLDLHKCVTHLFASWQLEVDSPISINLRQCAQGRADRKAWQELQWRAEGFKNGMRATADAKRRLARAVGRFLDGVRSRGALDGGEYLKLFKHLQLYAPDGVDLQPRKELCPR